MREIISGNAVHRGKSVRFIAYKVNGAVNVYGPDEFKTTNQEFFCSYDVIVFSPYMYITEIVNFSKTRTVYKVVSKRYFVLTSQKRK